MKEQQSILICTGIDDGYIWPWMVSIYSASIHSRNNLEAALGVIKGQFSKESLNTIKQFCEFFQIKLLYREFDFNFEVQLDGRIPVQSYIRLLWMDNLDRRFLWLDSDTLCLENWDHIFDHSSKEGPGPIIFATPDEHINRHGLNNFPSNKAFQVANGSYFNDGVFICDPLQWQEWNFPQEWKRLAEQHKEFGFEMHNQDILNYLLHDKKKLIPSPYNCIVSAPSRLNQRILHFAGGPKPWHLDSKSKRYFSSLETLKKFGTETGAFSGKNWIFEFENYWRHEDALVKILMSHDVLGEKVLKLATDSRMQLRNYRDDIKLSILNFVGRKWL